MTEMVERVAVAMCKAYGNDWSESAETASGLRSGDPGLPAKSDWREMARDAIEAMREPTEAMCHAATMIPPTWDCSVSAAKWRAMIDAALAEQQPASISRD